MPSVKREITVARPLDAVWAFVRDVDNWAPLMPGFEQHIAADSTHYWWKVRAVSGVFSRLLEIDVEVHEWNEPHDVRFTLAVRNENVTGQGVFTTREATDATRLEFDLELAAQGAMAPMVNALIDRFLADHAEEFVERVGAALESATNTGSPMLSPSAGNALLIRYRLADPSRAEVLDPAYRPLRARPRASGRVFRFAAESESRIDLVIGESHQAIGSIISAVAAASTSGEAGFELQETERLTLVQEQGDRRSPVRRALRWLSSKVWRQ